MIKFTHQNKKKIDRINETNVAQNVTLHQKMPGIDLKYDF